MSASRLYAAVAALVGWVSLAIQFVALHINAAARGVDVVTATINYFSYFTILSNILCAAVLTAVALDAKRGLGGFLVRPGAATGVAMYMAVTGVIYFLILRHIWNPQGLDWVADKLLHTVMPLAYVLFWLLFVENGNLAARHVGLSLVFPIAYAGYALVRGAAMGFYPYPFVNAAELGYPTVFVNLAGLVVGFVVLGSLVVGASRLARR